MMNEQISDKSIKFRTLNMQIIFLKFMIEQIKNEIFKYIKYFIKIYIY